MLPRACPRLATWGHVDCGTDGHDGQDVGQLSANSQHCSPPVGPRQPLHELSPANDGRDRQSCRKPPPPTRLSQPVTLSSYPLGSQESSPRYSKVFPSMCSIPPCSCCLQPLLPWELRPPSLGVGLSPDLRRGRCQPSTTLRSPGWDVCGRRKDFWVLSPGGAHSVTPTPGRGTLGPQDTLPPIPPAHPGVETLRGEKPRITREGV